MATEQLKNIFLSASVPMENRHAKYFQTADVIAIRDAVIALTQAVIPYHRLIWGGHPSITPLIYHVMEKFDLGVQEHVTLYQTLHFEKEFPEDNNKFENVIFTPDLGERDESINHMREKMFSENEFVAGVFIGGMDGVEIEFEMLKNANPNALMLPLASTGAASKLVFDNTLGEQYKEERLVTDYGYMSLFQDLLMDKI